MRDPRNEGGGEFLDLSQNFLADGDRVAAYDRLVADVFGFSPERPAVANPPWQVLAGFEPDGTCVAGIEVATVPLILDGTVGAANAIRLAGVAASHRGRGLFRHLMEGALRLCDARADGAPTLLYTEDPGLYTRFGFDPMAQHAFVGASPRASGRGRARRLDRADALVQIDRLAPLRAPVSLHCAVLGGIDLLRANLDDDDLAFALFEPSDVLIVFERDEEDLVVVDIVGATIPTMAEIVGALGAGARGVRTLFPPDRLAWEATPERDETGLMIRGAVPAAMRRPFMLPPTTSF